MILQDFYQIINTERSEGKIRTQIRLNGNHAVYAAHFPGKPVTPGVCLIQICKEIIERETGSLLSILKLKSVKFLQLIIPDQTSVLDVVCSIKEENGTYMIGAEFGNDTGGVMAKMSIVFQDKKA